MKIMVTSFKSSHTPAAALSAPDPAASHCQPTPLPETPGHSWESLDQSLVGVTAPFSWVLVHTRFCLGPPSVCFPVLCKFWWLYGGVNGDLLQESLCHTQVCCTQSPCPCGQATADPYLLRRHSNTVLALSLGPAVHKVCLSPLSASGGQGV